MQSSTNYSQFEKRENSDWPIFQTSENINNLPFWDKRPYLFFEGNQIVMKGTLKRIGKNKQIPKAYMFILLKTGELIYVDNNQKGKIQLDLSIVLKKIELTNEENEDKQKISAIRIERFQNCSIHIWNEDNSISINIWYNRLAQFCISSNFEGFFQLHDKLDEGAFSSVFTVTSQFQEELKNQKYAAKVYSKSLQQKIPAQQMKDFIYAECQILKIVNSQYIVKLYEIIQLEDVVILILEYVSGGTLYEILQQKVLNELMSLEILYQIMLAVKEVHHHGFVHRDIKLENIMIQSLNPIEIKLIDFGFAEKINRNKLVNGSGTAGYIAPELFQLAPYTENCDMFSLGVLFYLLLCGNSPFGTQNKEILLELNKTCNLQYLSKEWQNISSSTQKIVKKMLDKDHTKRITILELELLLDIHINKLRFNQANSRQALNQLQNCNNVIMQNQRPAIRTASNNKKCDDDDMLIEEKSIDNTNLINLKNSHQYYNKSKWVS
ncbi:unnamed protein product [Paramecium octaurelia]|uniref:Protein kinase domain-containing protein n=1 Tax=Paramecium octaurelia TaxID=43137 RepID=A0A8S1UUF4_PAROT|nr:unnamed protein product [Paramecium octaurelia]